MKNNPEWKQVRKLPTKPIIEGWYYEGDPEAEKAKAAGVNVTIIHSEEEYEEKVAEWLKKMIEVRRSMKKNQLNS